MATTKKIILEIEAKSEAVKKLKIEILEAKDALTKFKKETKDNKHTQGELNTKIVTTGNNVKTLNTKLKGLVKTKALDAKITKSEAGSINQLNALLARNKLRLNAMSKATREGTTAGNHLIKSNAALKRKIDQVNASQRKQTSGLKGVGKQLLATAAGFLGITVVIRKFIQGIGKALTTIIEFQKANSKLASIIGTNRRGIRELTEDAKLYGSTTAFTASQVTGLQTELAKLGFTQNQIKDSTKGILSLSAATGTDLAESAILAGSTLRAMGLDASEMGRVTDVLALSTSRSALDMQKLKDSLTKVTPVLKANNISLERGVAQLGELTNRGVEASTAGTGLRNVYLELSKQGLTFDEAMLKINSSTDKAKTALKLFGKRGAITGLILAGTGKETAALTKELEKSGGTAQKMADEQLDNFAGSVTKMKSAYEGLTLSFWNGNGAIRDAVDGLTSMFSAITEIRNGSDEFNTALEEEQLHVNLLTAELALSNTPLERKKEIIDELQKIAPDTIKNIDAENINYETLTTQVEAYNKVTIQRIALETLSKESKAILEEQGKKYLEVQKKQQAVLSLISQADVKAANSKGDLTDKIKTSVGTLEKLIAIQEKEGKIGEVIRGKSGQTIDTRTKEQLLLLKLRAAYGFLKKEQEEYNELLEDNSPILANNKAIADGLDLAKKANEEAAATLAAAEAKKEADAAALVAAQKALIVAEAQALLDNQKREQAKISADSDAEINDMMAEDAEENSIALKKEGEEYAASLVKKAELDAIYAEKKAKLEEIKIKAGFARGVQRAGEIDDLKGFAKAGLNIVRQGVADQIQAKLALAFASQMASVFKEMPWFVAPILAPIAGLAVKTVFNNLVPKFSEGTVLSGKTHPEGGIPLYSPSGGFYGEAEDKETILTAGVSENPQLMDIASRINVLGGGKTLSNNSGFFAEGGSLAKQPIVYQPVLILNDVNDLNEMQRKIDVMQKF